MGQVFSDNSLLSGSQQLVVGTWNVKGLTDTEIFCICMHMRRNSIDLVFLQETRAPQAECYNEGGYKVILSGDDLAQKNWSGVGFITAPRCTHRIHGFLQYSDRMASLIPRKSTRQVPAYFWKAGFPPNSTLISINLNFIIFRTSPKHLPNFFPEDFPSKSKFQ